MRIKLLGLKNQDCKGRNNSWKEKFIINKIRITISRLFDHDG